jgi:NhaP-type Na+/H+ or K+/H+ antiporter
MEWALAAIALTLIAFGVVSRRVAGTPITPAIIFVGAGLLVGPQALDLLDTSPTGESVKLLVEATLTLVLFADASRIDMRTLRREYAVPARLLGVGLPLTIALGTLLAAALFDVLSVPEALVLAVLLAPTDAALGQAVVTEPRLPSRIRQGLNVESGLNDGICVPLLFIALAVAEADVGEVGAAHAVHLVVEEIGYGILGGSSPERSPPPPSPSAAPGAGSSGPGSRSSRSRQPRSHTASPHRSTAPASSPRSSRA